MNDADCTDLRQQITHLTKSVKSGLCIVLFGISVLNVAAAICIPKFQLIFHHMFGGKALPGLTVLVIGYRVALLVISMALPVFGIVICSLVSDKKAVALLVALIAAAFIQTAMVVIALFLPLIPTLSNMSNGSGG